MRTNDLPAAELQDAEDHLVASAVLERLFADGTLAVEMDPLSLLCQLSCLRSRLAPKPDYASRSGPLEHPHGSDSTSLPRTLANAAFDDTFHGLRCVTAGEAREAVPHEGFGLRALYVTEPSIDRRLLVVRIAASTVRELFPCEAFRASAAPLNSTAPPAAVPGSLRCVFRCARDTGRGGQRWLQRSELRVRHLLLHPAKAIRHACSLRRAPYPEAVPPALRSELPTYRGYASRHVDDPVTRLRAVPPRLLQLGRADEAQLLAQRLLALASQSNQPYRARMRELLSRAK